MKPLRNDHGIWCPKSCTGECYAYVPEDVPDGPRPKVFRTKGWNPRTRPELQRVEPPDRSRLSESPERPVSHEICGDEIHIERCKPVPVRQLGMEVRRVFMRAGHHRYVAVACPECKRERRIPLSYWRVGRLSRCTKCPGYTKHRQHRHNYAFGKATEKREVLPDPYWKKHGS